MTNVSHRRLLQAATTGILTLVLCGISPLFAQTASFTAGGFTLRAENGGVIAVIAAKGERREAGLTTEIEGLTNARPVQVSVRSGALELVHTLADSSSGRRCTVIERFSKGNDETSLHWEVEIRGEGSPWSSPIHTKVLYHPNTATRFWTAWSNPNDDGEPEGKGNGWGNPLTEIAVPDRRFYYGAPYFKLDQPRIGFSPTGGNLISLPLASFLQPEKDTGLSVIFSPKDPLLDMTLDVSHTGSADFTQYFQRLGSQRILHYSIDLVNHEADWRGPLRWMVDQYPTYFNPALPIAQHLGGTSAYSTFEGTVDARKFHEMDFKTNWKASFDFPYMGMFLPPTDSGRWTRFAGDSGGKVNPGQENARGSTSIAQMADYSARMRKQDFYVLNYFNVTEFGAGIVFPKPPLKSSSAELWKDPNAWLYQRLSAALLLAPKGVKGVSEGHPYYTWGKGVILDCGEPSYQKFLLEQAKRHIDKLPQSSGICIDRMDWLRFYNQKADDGQSWFNNAPARSLYHSWHDLMSKLLPMMHNSGKVVFVNNHLKRIDLLQNIDGIFDEFGSHPASLNLTAFLTLKRPALGWVNDEEVIRKDPDGFFQRSLLLGTFPMAPFPGNDHSLTPSPWVDQEFLTYGPLMKALDGRSWVLTPHAIDVDRHAAQANVFSTPNGLAIPVVFGGNATSVRVTLRAAPHTIASIDAVAPGVAQPLPVHQTRHGENLILDVPLRRGCAIVRIK